MRSSTVIRVTLMVALVALLGACTSAPAPTPEPQQPQQPMGEFANAPSWVLSGCSSFWGDDSPSKICGVGSAGGSRNHSLMVTAAQGRGRTAIARSLNVHVKAMLKDYQSTTTGGEEFGNAANDEQHIVDVSKQLTDIELSGVEQRDMWMSPSGQIYVLMVYDADKFTAAVSQMDQLSETIRKAVIERADASFSELDDELEKN